MFFCYFSASPLMQIVEYVSQGPRRERLCHLSTRIHKILSAFEVQIMILIYINLFSIIDNVLQRPRGVRSTDRGHRSHGGVGGGYPQKRKVHISKANHRQSNGQMQRRCLSKNSIWFIATPSSQLDVHRHVHILHILLNVESLWCKYCSIYDGPYQSCSSTPVAILTWLTCCLNFFHFHFLLVD
jgi:hypothetical protein